MPQVTVLYVGSSLLAPLRQAEREINERYRLGLRLATHSCTLPLDESQWKQAEIDIAEADVVFVTHVTDNENSFRICAALDLHLSRHHAVIAINCLSELMKRTHFRRHMLFQGRNAGETKDEQPIASRMLRKLGTWLASYVASRRGKGAMRRPEQYLKFAGRLPQIIRLIPSAGRFGGMKHYLTLFCYFLQPTPANIRSMVLYAIKYSVPGLGRHIRTEPPESRPVVGIYHPDSSRVFESFHEYRVWYEQRPMFGACRRASCERPRGPSRTSPAGGSSRTVSSRRRPRRSRRRIRRPFVSKSRRISRSSARPYRAWIVRSSSKASRCSAST